MSLVAWQCAKLAYCSTLVSRAGHKKHFPFWSCRIADAMKHKIPLAERPHRHCTSCNEVTPWNTHDRCMVCQRKRSRAYARRLKESGGPFSKETKARLRVQNPEKCPLCHTPWDAVPTHGLHPETPWHFDHIISPQFGGTNDPSNAQIMCWPCNLKKLNKPGSVPPV